MRKVTWKCESGHENEKAKPGVTPGNVALLYCSECSEKVMQECVSVTETKEKGKRNPWD